MLSTSVYPRKENNKDGDEKKEMIWWVKKISNSFQETNLNQFDVCLISRFQFFSKFCFAYKHIGVPSDAGREVFVQN